MQRYRLKSCSGSHPVHKTSVEKLLFSKFFKRPIAALKPRRNPEDIAVQNVPTGAIL